MKTPPRQAGEDVASVHESRGDPPAFEWPVYADATFAGLAVLIPIPLVDMFFEWAFWRRTPGAIAKHRKRALPRSTVQDLNRSRWGLAGCLLFPLWLVLAFLKRLYRTILYFLTVKEATDKLSHNWHRAFLIDHAIRQGHLDDPTYAPVAVQTIHALLKDVTTSPVTRLAGQVVGSVKHVLRAALRWFRRHVEDEEARQAHERIGRGWADLRLHFAGVARDYDRRIADFITARRAESAPD